MPIYDNAVIRELRKIRTSQKPTSWELFFLATPHVNLLILVLFRLKLLFVATLLLQVGNPRAVIRGRVTVRGSNEPIHRLGIFVTYQAYSNEGNIHTAVESTGYTNENGGYELTVSHPATYIVSTSASAAGRIFLPEASAPLRIDSNWQTGTVDFAVQPGKPVKVTVRFVDGLGHRYPHMEWVWGSLPTKQKRYVNTSSFDIDDVIPGSYVLHSRRFDEIEHRAETAVSFDVRDKDVTVDLVSNPSYDVAGFLRFEHSRFPVRPLPQPRLAVGISRVIEKSSDSEVVSVPAEVINNPAAGFSIRNAPAGLYRLGVTGLPPSFYVKSAMRGREDVLNKGLQVPGGQKADNIIISIDDDAASISGTAYGPSGAPSPRAKVVLVPDQPNILRLDLYHPVTADYSGKFVIQNVAPGKYSLYAWKTLRDADYFDMDIMRRYAGKGKALEIGSKAQLLMDLVVLE